MYIAYEIGVKTPATVRNAFNKEKQIVSDKVLTDIMDTVKINGFVVYHRGEKKYFISQ